jgi:hypothetical protein
MLHKKIEVPKRSENRFTSKRRVFEFLMMFLDSGYLIYFSRAYNCRSARDKWRSSVAQKRSLD